MDNRHCRIHDMIRTNVLYNLVMGGVEADVSGNLALTMVFFN